MYRRAFFGLLFAVAAALSMGSPGAAQTAYAPDPYGAGVLPLDRVLPAVRAGRPGQFYDAEGPFPDANGQYHYRIKWLTPEGRVVWLDTDARSGRVLGVARGDWREQGPPPVGRFWGRGPRGPYNMPGGPRRPFGGPPGGGFGGAWNGHRG